MLRHHKFPKTSINHYQIELVPTQEEMVYGLQPYIKVSQIELLTAIADDRLGFLEQPSLHVVTPRKNKSRGKKARVHKLKLLIQQTYNNSDNKNAEAIWKTIGARDFIWIESMDPWNDGRSEAKIKWNTGDKSEKPFSRGAFENYVSNLATGKERFSEELYDEIYDD